MGVGVYHNDFNGTGDTFIVSPPYPDQKSYHSFLDSMLEELGVKAIEIPDGSWKLDIISKNISQDDAIEIQGHKGDRTFDSLEDAAEFASDRLDGYYQDEDSWRQDLDRDFYKDLKDTVGNACDDLNMPEYDNRVCNEMSDDFHVLALTSKTCVGIRGWETDYIVGISSRKSNNWEDHIAEPLPNTAEFLCHVGRPVDEYAAKAIEQHAVALEYIRLCLMEGGMECRHRVSGYTSSEYKKPDDLTSQKRDLLKKHQELAAYLDMTAEKALPALSSAERVKIVQQMQAVIEDERCHDFDPFDLSVLMYSPEWDVVIGVDPYSGEIHSEGVPGIVDANLRDKLAGAKAINGLVPIPRNSDFEAGFAQYQTKLAKVDYSYTRRRTLLVTADEYVAGSKSSFGIRYHPLLRSIGTVIKDAISVAHGFTSNFNRNHENSRPTAPGYQNESIIYTRDLISKIRHTQFNEYLPALTAALTVYGGVTNNSEINSALKVLQPADENGFDCDDLSPTVVLPADGPVSRPRMR